MTEAVRVALIQMVSGFEVDENLAHARVLLEKAVAQGARLAVLPENFAAFQNRHLIDVAQRESNGDGAIRRFLAEQARRLGIWIVGGSVPLRERPDGTTVPDGRVRAACLVYNDQGLEVARYDKIHLFDAEVGDQQGRYQESSVFEPGEEVVTVDTPAGRLGLSICYDLRFPELYRSLRAKGAQWLVVPSAFTYRTGEAHWEVLLRARAVENQVWICAPDQGGWHDERRRTWGHSMIVDPWGKIIQGAEEGEAVITAELDLTLLEKTRAAMPVWEHRRLGNEDPAS